MAEKVVYTVLTGGYDRLQQPRVSPPGWDFVCFTDGPAGRDGVWELRPIPYQDTPVMMARWAKLHPHLLLPEYEFSVFMDANLRIEEADFYTILEEARDGNSALLKLPWAVFAPYAALSHPERDCVWEELRYCYLKDKLRTRFAIRWHRYLRQMAMPRHAGLAETNVLVRVHHQPDVVALDQRWWELIQLSGGSRDQLAFTPALVQLGLNPALLFPAGSTARNVSCIHYELHPVQGGQNVPGRLDWANLKYNLRLLWRKLVLLCLR